MTFHRPELVDFLKRHGGLGVGGATMHVTALPAGLRRFTLADLPRERWRNGAGWTRTVASAAHVADGGQPDWRVSLAEISQGAPFSLFPGMDRTAVLVRGGPVRLRGVASEAGEARAGGQLVGAVRIDYQHEEVVGSARRLAWGAAVVAGFKQRADQIGEISDAELIAIIDRADGVEETVAQYA